MKMMNEKEETGHRGSSTRVSASMAAGMPYSWMVIGAALVGCCDTRIAGVDAFARTAKPLSLSPMQRQRQRQQQAPPKQAQFAATASSSIAEAMRESTAATTATTVPPISNRHLRWQKNDDEWKMQTAVTTFERIVDDRKETVKLIAQLHFGSKDYFEGITASIQDMDSVHYELLVDDSLLDQSDPQQPWKRHLKEPIMASTNDQNLAANYGWECQVNVMDYAQQSQSQSQTSMRPSVRSSGNIFDRMLRNDGVDQPEWIHADFTRQEFLELVNEQQQQQQQQQHNSGTSSDGNENDNSQVRQRQGQPLWALVSPSSQVAEAVSALVSGPPTLTLNRKSSLRRRLFSNLFLSGHTFTSQLRSVLWFTLPSPELFILLLDYSSLFWTKRQKKQTSIHTFTGISDVVEPIWNNVCSFQLTNIRRLIFGQTLLAASANDDNDLLIRKRNEHALEIMQRTLLFSDERSSRDKTSYNTAVLYGSSHCPNLQDELLGMGFQPTSQEWKTAWAVSTASVSNQDAAVAVADNNNNNNNNGIDLNINTNTNAMNSIYLILFASGYLGIGALDWVDMFHGTILAQEQGQADGISSFLDIAGIGGLYLIRHVALYLGLSKFLMNWEYK